MLMVPVAVVARMVVPVFCLAISAEVAGVAVVDGLVDLAFIVFCSAPGPAFVFFAFVM